MKQIFLIVLSLISFQLVNAQISEKVLSQFSTPEVRELVKEYDDFMNLYIDAVKNNDAAQIQDLAASSTLMGEKIELLVDKLTPADAKVFSDYEAYISKKLVAAFTNETIDYEFGSDTKAVEKGTHLKN